jgi:hypothetical protein
MSYVYVVDIIDINYLYSIPEFLVLNPCGILIFKYLAVQKNKCLLALYGGTFDAGDHDAVVTSSPGMGRMGEGV